MPHVTDSVNTTLEMATMRITALFSLPPVQRLVSAAIVLFACILAIARSAVAQTTPYYPPGSYSPFSIFEGVNSDGSSSFSFPSDGSPITVMGIVLNNPADMLDSTPNYNTTPWNLGGQWQIFIQAYSDPTVGGTPGDFGGCEVWMGQCYGNLPFMGEPDDSYTEQPMDGPTVRD